MAGVIECRLARIIARNLILSLYQDQIRIEPMIYFQARTQDFPACRETRAIDHQYASPSLPRVRACLLHENVDQRGTLSHCLMQYEHLDLIRVVKQVF